jgi:adenine-specific DNA-methyltransferase
MNKNLINPKLNNVNTSTMENIVEKLSIDKIENCLVQIFLEENKIVTKNILIKNLLKNNLDSDKNYLKQWLKNNQITLTLKNMERIFELLFDTNERKTNGRFYTPDNIVNYIIKKTITNNTHTVCDISCGSGAFLIEATEFIYKLDKKPISKILETQIFGVDISQRSILHTKIILTLYMLSNGEEKKFIQFNLIVGDSISLDWNDKFPILKKIGGFDAVIGNPPYVRAKNIPKNIRDFLHSKKWKTAPRGKADLYIPFVELGVDLINSSGKVGYIIPNGYFTLLSTKQLRKFLQTQKLIKEIIDFDYFQLFEDVTIYTCITILDKKPKKNFNYKLITSSEQIFAIDQLKNMDFIKINFDQLNNDKWILLNKKNEENIRKLEFTGESLDSLCKIKTGIATLKNDLYVFKDFNEKGKFYEIKYKNKKFLIEKSVTREILKSGQIKNELDITNNKRRIIFPYELNLQQKRMYHIPEVVFKKKYPECYKYFLSIKSELITRDKGLKKYKEWYAYGRTQGLQNDASPKLIVADMGDNPCFVLCKKNNVLFYTGYGVWLNPSKNIDIQSLKKILNSDIFRYYMRNTSKPYQHGYRSYAKRFLKNFSIPEFTSKELDIIKNTKNLEKFLIKKYQLETNSQGILI